MERIHIHNIEFTQEAKMKLALCSFALGLVNGIGIRLIAGVIKDQTVKDVNIVLEQIIEVSQED